jgi:hypothetical protein
MDESKKEFAILKPKCSPHHDHEQAASHSACP